MGVCACVSSRDNQPIDTLTSFSHNSDGERLFTQSLNILYKGFFLSPIRVRAIEKGEIVGEILLIVLKNKRLLGLRQTSEEVPDARSLQQKS